jgi:hypothetical protein
VTFVLIPIEYFIFTGSCQLTVSLLFRERTVGALITNGAASSALTDPTPQFSCGRTPADLASENGHRDCGFVGRVCLDKSTFSTHIERIKGLQC